MVAARRCGVVGCLPIGIVWLRMIDDNSYVDRHVVSEVLISRNENVAVFVLEAKSTGSTLIETVEIFHCRDDRISGIVGEYLYFERKSCTVI